VRRIAVLTGTRADFGLLKHLASALESDPRAELQLIVTGSHISGTPGATVEEVIADGLPIAATVPIWTGADGPVAAAHDFGVGVGAYAACLTELAPDAVVILGDRLEALAMANAATILEIPIAHIHGGEVTEGAMDDALRHAITKLAYLHFTTTEEHRRRVIQMGEDPARVFDFGAPVLDALAELDLLTVDEIEARFGLRPGPESVLMTFHPAAFDVIPSGRLIRELLAALSDLDGTQVIITGTNSDIGSDDVRQQIARFIAEHPDRAIFVESFGQLGYLSVMQSVGVVVGNSSSTVLEAPLLGTPSVLIGDRQEGRPMLPSVIKPPPNRADILEALRSTLVSPTNRIPGLQATVFGTPGFARRAAEELITHAIPRPPRKRFRDLP